MKAKTQPTNKPEPIYQPPAWGFRYLAACIDWELRQTKSARCKAAKIGRTTLYEAEQDDRFVRWLDDHLGRMVTTEHREVKTSLLRLCMRGDLEAIKLWHQLYGDYIPTERRIVDGALGNIDDKALDQISRILEAGSAEGKGQKIH